MDFQWGMVKHKVPLRVVNLTRFTGNEDVEKIIDFVDKNKEKEFGDFSMNYVTLALSDHYIQKKNTQTIDSYEFKH